MSIINQKAVVFNNYKTKYNEQFGGLVRTAKEKKWITEKRIDDEMFQNGVGTVAIASP